MMLADSNSIPKPPKPWKQLTNLERSRWKDARALWRRKNQASKYKRVGRLITKIRTSLEMRPEEFAEKLEVSIITLRRWERGYGYTPSPETMQRIKKLERKS